MIESKQVSDFELVCSIFNYSIVKIAYFEDEKFKSKV